MSYSAGWTFHIVTLGCKINQYESQAIREAWSARGGQEVALEDAPNVFLVNSCAITARGERDTRHALYRLQRHFATEQSDTVQAATAEKPSCFRILTGCAAPLVAKTFSQQEQETYFDALVLPQAKALLMQGPEAVGGAGAFAFPSQKVSLPEYVYPFGEKGFSITSFRRARPVLKVQDGCSHRCTYCIVPLVRGKSVSRPAHDVVQEASRLLEAGHSEIMLSGINLHQYGRDFASTTSDTIHDFWDLVALLEKELAPAWQGKARLRISSLEPSQLSPKGLDVLTSSSLLCPHIHLSLQHGSPHVLKRMGRGHYKLAALQENVRILRQHWPLMGIGADILMGFAGEKEEDVVATLELIQELGLTYAHVFPYSVRPGTPAANFAEQVPHAVKLERAARVRTLVEEQQERFVQGFMQKSCVELVLDGAAGSLGVVEQSSDTPACGETRLYKGVNAQYAACHFVAPLHFSAQGIVRAKPVRAEGDVLHCEPLLDASCMTHNKA